MMQAQQVNHAQELVNRYRAFYLAQRKPGGRISTEGAIKPLKLATQILINSDSSLRGQMLQQSIAARLMKLMQQIHGSGGAQGRWVIASKQEEMQAIEEFSRYLVVEVFEKAFNGDLARLAGRQMGYLEDTCEFLYRRAEDTKSENLHP